MPLWGRLKVELDRAGRAAQQALDEGRLRLEVHRARQRADRAAQALGYATYQARKTGSDVAPEQAARLAAEIGAAEAEAARVQTQIDGLARGRGEGGSGPTMSEPQPPV